MNNPIRFIDPDGMAVEEIEGGFKYTKEDAVAMFSQLKNEYLDQDEQDPPEKWRSGFDWGRFTHDLNYNKSNFDKWLFGAGLAATTIENTPGSFRLSTTKRGISPNYYRNAWSGNQYTRSFNIGKVGKGLGNLGTGLGIIADAYGVYEYTEKPTSENAVHPDKAVLNLGVTAYSMYINPPEGIAYGLIDNFFPGGWGNGVDSGFFYEQNKIQFQLDRISNDGPYYIRLVPLGSK
ncbi:MULTISPECIES: hypothetical protein [unclassified Sphingobacterium]|uniref:hypothetical protein n=1 Tax=unclassified Sphingobacterium TaxID=2609468 RepID=UPI0025F8B3C3|nr:MULTISPECIES: hypothetical protein [unclassified Sphingobacterium]